MNTQTLRWSDINVNEGYEIQTLSSTEVEDVSGGLGPIVGALLGSGMVLGAYLIAKFT